MMIFLDFNSAFHLTHFSLKIKPFAQTHSRKISVNSDPTDSNLRSSKSKLDKLFGESEFGILENLEIFCTNCKRQPFLTANLFFQNL